MKKGDKTRHHIIMKSAELFNQKGYAGCSINDIMVATGLKKGGIYRFFKNKDEIALESFTYAVNIVAQHFSEATEGDKSAIEKILSIFDVYEDVVSNPPFVGGCPVLNTAIDSDDAHPELREKALSAMNDFLVIIRNILMDGIQNKELSPDIDLNSMPSFIFSILEGSIMASKLEGDSKHIAFGKQQLLYFLQTHQAEDFQ